MTLLLSPRTKSRQRGFSIIELVAVIAIMLILMAMALPSMVNSLRPMRLRNDASSIASLVMLSRMRASAEFSRVQVACNTAPTSGPAHCWMQSQQYGSTTWTPDSQKLQVYLSAGVSFGIPQNITTPLVNQAVAYQGDASQGVTTTPVIMFNSRGIPLDTVSLQPQSDYALYLTDSAGSHMAVSVELTGRPVIYSYTNGVFAVLKE